MVNKIVELACYIAKGIKLVQVKHQPYPLLFLVCSMSGRGFNKPNNFAQQMVNSPP